MKKIMLVSKGRYNAKEAVVCPKTVEELTDEVIKIAYGFHCDFDSVVGYIFDDSAWEDDDSCEDTHEMYSNNISLFVAENHSYESQNLIYTGYNCDDGLTYREDTDDFIDDNGDIYDTQDDAYIDYTREDFGGDIADLFAAFKNSEEK